MKIGVITYNIKHRKTYDILCLLKAKGYQDVLVIALPLSYKKTYQPLVQHRPELNIHLPDIEDMCVNFGYEYILKEELDCTFDDRIIFLVGGAGILPDDFVRKYTVINAHPGYIPDVRGLDSYKWAVYEAKKIGVSTHLIGEYVDAGELIERRELKINDNDTFHTVAARLYENEIDMLVSALEKLEDEHILIIPETDNVHKRMPHILEKELFEKFELLKRLNK